MFSMYLPARMFCTLARTSSIPMGAVNFYMQEHFLHSLIRLITPIFPDLTNFYRANRSFARANRAMVTNNLTVLTEVSAN